MGERSLHNTSTEETIASGSNVKVYGNPDIWVLVTKADDDKHGWMKSTKAMQVNGGVFLLVTTEHMNPSTKVVTACAETLSFAPGITLKDIPKDPPEGISFSK